MDHNPNDETIKEILEEDHIEIKNGRKKKSCLMRAIIFIIMLTVIFLGFIYIQQYLLDIEAEAIVRAVQTATALVNDPSTRKDLISDEGQPDAAIPVQQPTPRSRAESAPPPRVAAQARTLQ